MVPQSLAFSTSVQYATLVVDTRNATAGCRLGRALIWKA
jgi:hypothetical protein